MLVQSGGTFTNLSSVNVATFPGSVGTYLMSGGYASIQQLDVGGGAAAGGNGTASLTNTGTLIVMGPLRRSSSGTDSTTAAS